MGANPILWQDETDIQYNDNYFKQIITISLPRSWDTFTSLYIGEYEDKNDLNMDPKCLINSQKLISIISHKYEL